MSSDVPRTIRPEQALGDGRSDAVAVIGLWLLRRAFLPLAFVGIAVAWLGGRTNPSVEWSSPSEVAEDLLSPLAVLMIAIAVRLGASFGALAAALPIAHRCMSEVGFDGGHLARVSDTFRAARALRAFRWTSPARRLCVERLGPGFGWLRHADAAMTIATMASVVALVAVVWAHPAR